MDIPTSPAKGVTGRETEVPVAVGYVPCPFPLVRSPHHLPRRGAVMCGEHQSQTQDCASSWEGKKTVQSVLAKSQQPLKYFRWPSPCALPALPPSCLSQEKCLGPAPNCGQDGLRATFLENCLGIWMHGLSPSLLHFKRSKFPFSFLSTFLFQPRGIRRVFEDFGLFTAALSSHGHDPPASLQTSNQASPPWWGQT